MYIRQKSSHWLLLLVLVVLVLIRGLIYIAIIPPWLAPDEPAHFEAIRLMGQQGVQPTEKVYRTTPMHAEMAPSFEAFRIWQISRLTPPQPDNVDAAVKPFFHYYPPTSSGSLIIAENYPLLYHHLLAPLAEVLKPFGIIQQLYLLRVTSLLFTTITVVAGWFFGRTIFPGNVAYALGITSFLVFLPMHIHVNTSVNVDVLVTLLASLFFWMLARIFCEGASSGKLLTAAGLMLIAILTKPTALFLIPTVVAAVVVYLARRFEWSLKVTLFLLTLFSLFSFIGGVLFFQIANGGRLAALSSFSTDSISSLANYFSGAALTVYLHTIRWGFLSFWGLFGWANIPIPFAWIRLLAVICVMIGAGAALFLVRHIINGREGDRAIRNSQKDLLMVLLFSLVFALIGIYTPIIATQSTSWGPPSRYLFPALLPLALYFFIGFQQLIPPRFNYLTLPLWTIALISFDSLVIFFVLIPSIYG